MLLLRIQKLKKAILSRPITNTVDRVEKYTLISRLTNYYVIEFYKE